MGSRSGVGLLRVSSSALGVLGGSGLPNRQRIPARSKVETLVGPGLFEKTRDKTVIDFGCGYGDQTIELAKRGAKLVIGVDIREEVLDAARRKPPDYGTSGSSRPSGARVARQTTSSR
jgi:predicted RNA methylase